MRFFLIIALVLLILFSGCVKDGNSAKQQPYITLYQELKELKLGEKTWLHLEAYNPFEKKEFELCAKKKSESQLVVKIEGKEESCVVVHPLQKNKLDISVEVPSSYTTNSAYLKVKENIVIEGIIKSKEESTFYLPIKVASEEYLRKLRVEGKANVERRVSYDNVGDGLINIEVEFNKDVYKKGEEGYGNLKYWSNLGKVELEEGYINNEKMECNDFTKTCSFKFKINPKKEIRELEKSLIEFKLKYKIKKDFPVEFVIVSEKAKT